MRDRLPMIFSTTALVVAVLGVTPLGEAAYNAVVPRNSVGTAQLKNNSITATKLRKGSVTNAKLRGDAVTSGKVKNRSLRAIDFAVGQLPAGPQGPQGAKGDKGDKGDVGPSGATTVTVRRSSAVRTKSGQLGLKEAQCLEGERAVGGGIGLMDVIAGGALVAPAITIRNSQPLPNRAGTTPTGWAAGWSATAAVGDIAVYVVCAKP